MLINTVSEIYNLNARSRTVFFIQNGVPYYQGHGLGNVQSFIMDQLCLWVDDWHQVDELKNFRDKVVIGLIQ